MESLVHAALTYLLHSTLLVAAALGGCALLGRRRLAVQEAILRAALLGGFVTTAVQIGLGVEPLSGTLRLPAAAPSLAVAEIPEPPAGYQHGTAAGLGGSGPWRPSRPGMVEPDLAARRGPGFADGLMGLARSAQRSWTRTLLAGWSLLALAAGIRLLVAALRLRTLLRGRRAVEDPRLLDQLALVQGRLGLPAVPVSAAASIPVPLATGVWRPEVCLPARALAELGHDEQVALCAHELAHVARRDPGWILLARLVECLAPVQPLNWLARHRLAEIAECLSDDLAVEASARPLGLARSLVDVASWSLSERPVLPAAAAALSVRSRLGHRVERLMDPFRRLEHPSRLVLPLAALGVVATALLSPAVSGSPAETPALAPDQVTATTTKPAAVPRTETAGKPVQTRVPAEVETEASTEAEAGIPDEPPVAEEADGGEAAARPALDAAQRRELERRLERLARRIEERARGGEDASRALEAQARLLAPWGKEQEAEIQRLSQQMARLAAEVATAAVEQAAGDDARGAAEASREQARAARQQAVEQMTALREQMRALTERTSGEQAEQARALAEQVRPSQAELAEIRELSRQLSGDARREALAASQEARDALRQAGEALRDALRELDAAAMPEAR